MKKVSLDKNQIALQSILQQLAHHLETQKNENFLKKFFSESKPVKSFYVYGNVGRGKSMLMSEFFKLVTIPKVYFHFNAFMRLIQEALRDIRREDKKYKDELVEAVKRVVENNRLVCFDEFQVVDITDAMLLLRIFSYLFSQGVTVVFTSNAQPLDLYKNGLQREVFLEFVKNVLLTNCEVFHLDGAVDYRQQYTQNLTKRYFISNKKNRATIKEIIANLTKSQKLKSKTLKVWGRDVKIKKTFEKIAVINFEDLCAVDFAASDYQTICQTFDLIFLLKLPRLTADNVNEARRFVLFIDEAYENKVALIIQAKVKISEIYKEGTGAEAFKRTASRLNEIKSDSYWQGSKINHL